MWQSDSDGRQLFMIQSVNMGGLHHWEDGFFRWFWRPGAEAALQKPTHKGSISAAFSLKAKWCVQGKEEHGYLPFKERLCHLSLKFGSEQHFSLNREFSTEASFLTKTCLLQIMHGADNTGPAGHRNWSQSSTFLSSADQTSPNQMSTYLKNQLLKTKKLHFNSRKVHLKAE